MSIFVKKSEHVKDKHCLPATKQLLETLMEFANSTS